MEKYGDFGLFKSIPDVQVWVKSIIWLNIKGCQEYPYVVDYLLCIFSVKVKVWNYILG